MASYKLSDGSVVDAPDAPNAEQAAWLKSEGAQPHKTPNTFKDIGKQALTGAVEGAVRAPFIGLDLINMGANAIEKTWPGTVSPRLDGITKEMPSSRVLNGLVKLTGVEPPKAETRAGRWANSIGNGVGGSLIAGVGAVPKLASAGPGLWNGLKRGSEQMLKNTQVQGGMIGAGAEFGGEMSTGFDPGEEQNPIARAIGGLVPVAGSIALRHVRAPTYDRAIYEAGKDLTPKDFAAAQVKAAQMKEAGSKTFTLTDTLPSTSKLRPVTSEVASAPGGEALYRKLVERKDGDIADVLNSAKSDAQGVAVPGYTGLETGNARDIAITNAARHNRTGAMRAELQASPLLPKSELGPVLRALQDRAKNAANAGTDDARFAASAMDDLKGMPTRQMPAQSTSMMDQIFRPQGYNLEALSKRVKGLRTKEATVDGPSGRVLENAAAVGAARTAEDALRKASPNYDAAMNQYVKKSPQVDIARILEENKLQPQVGAQSSSLQTDIVREQLAKALAKVDPVTAAKVQNKITTADTLDQLHPSPGVPGTQPAFGNTAGSMVVAPISGIRRKLQALGRDKANREVAEILANPTKQNYELLQAMIARDPSLARYARDLSNMNSLNSSTQTKGSAP